MSIIDPDGRLQARCTKEECYRAAKQACGRLKGCFIDRVDEGNCTLYLKGDIPRFFWGEMVVVNIFQTDAGLTEVFISSVAKVGKNRKNVMRVQRAIEEELQYITAG